MIEDSLFNKVKKIIYTILKVEQFIKFFNHFGTALISIILAILVVVLIFRGYLPQKDFDEGVTTVLIIVIIGLWILLFVASTLREIVLEEIRDSIEKEIFGKLEKMEKKIQILERKIDKILDIIYDTEKPSEEFSGREPSSLSTLGRI